MLTQRRIQLVLLLILTFTTGIIDAAGYLGLDKVFAGNMTGNVVILGMAAVGADELPVAGPAVALVGFLVGAALAGRAVRGQPTGWSPRCSWLLIGAGLLMSSVAAMLLAFGDDLARPWALTVTAGMAAAMGVQAAAARHVAIKDLTTVVVTSTITGLAADSRVGAGNEQPWLRRAGAISLIALGALAGATLLMVHIGLAVATAAALMLGVAIVGQLTRSGDTAEQASSGHTG
ncbi:uncharacterized membrane protein YoaK (UPF0700 family) [Tamaricihabitans halophyticus]|uniref:Uncharacterized membrane protein YoaK (UPF0700 family) n=1 Tax=Tamaricihabitans halophyticus TaxID=1262583 RepID=A0A4V6NRA2_9PSEU|nr:YoaK family protein [Tamaricihabitans halophyticus]TCP50766.1 uncharacterized membrane protein YoaK (UPF0700 family) [Tamaricihabitans halophyticus]